MTLIIQKQAPHGTQSMGFYFYFYFLFFPQLPTLFPPGKGPFASLARVPVSPPPPSSPSLKSGGPFLFFLLLPSDRYELVLRQRSCDGEAPLQLLHLNLLFKELYVSFPCLCFCLFRVFPCSSVANSFASASSSFRVNPWLMLLLY